MLVFKYEPNNNYQPTELEINEMHQQWGAFIGKIAIQEKLVSTHQLSFEGRQLFSDKSIVEGIHVTDHLIVAGNMIVKALTMDEADEISKDCPILKMGGMVEVRAIETM